jgi:hypothetical protein
MSPGTSGPRSSGERPGELVPAHDLGHQAQRTPRGRLIQWPSHRRNNRLFCPTTGRLIRHASTRSRARGGEPPELAEFHQTERIQTRCAFCTETFDGTFRDGRVWFVALRLQNRLQQPPCVYQSANAKSDVRGVRERERRDSNPRPPA